jgi:hypothetical protein
MSAIDFVLWQRFRLRNRLPFVRVYYDVAVGEGAIPGAASSPELLAAWSRITRPRVDVVGEALNAWTVIEIRGGAGPGAIGSLLVYRDLWSADPPDQRPVALWLITDVFPQNLVGSLALANIQLHLV